jgi:hypothetical protein
MCLNRRCGTEFSAWEANPECPKCGNVRVQWVPGGGHVAGTSRAADVDLRTLADNYGLSNLMSAARGERAKPPLNRPSAPRATRNDAVQFSPGFASRPYVMDNQGHAHAVCEPSMQNVNFKAKVGTELPLGPGRLGLPSPRENTRIEGTHRGKP